MFAFLACPKFNSMERPSHHRQLCSILILVVQFCPPRLERSHNTCRLVVQVRPPRLEWLAAQGCNCTTSSAGAQLEDLERCPASGALRYRSSAARTMRECKIICFEYL